MLHRHLARPWLVEEVGPVGVRLREAKGEEMGGYVRHGRSLHEKERKSVSIRVVGLWMASSRSVTCMKRKEKSSQSWWSGGNQGRSIPSKGGVLGGVRVTRGGGP